MKIYFMLTERLEEKRCVSAAEWKHIVIVNYIKDGQMFGTREPVLNKDSVVKGIQSLD